MAKKTYKDRVFTQRNVLDASIERINHLFDVFDKVVVSFSGGKDSSVVLNLVLKVARERNKLPLEVLFFDEEINTPLTLEYVHRVRQNPDLDFKWYCLPFKHRNGCTTDSEHAWWYCWDPTKTHLWCNTMPDFAIKHHPSFKKGMMYIDLVPHLFERGIRSVVCTGIRSEESPRRQNMAMSKKHENYIFIDDNFRHAARAIPIYDWSRTDVWKLVNEWKLDYNRHYDLLNMTDLNGKYLKQRVCGNPFGEEPIRDAYVAAECFPELFNKMLKRVQGFETAWRYSNTELYLGGKKPEKVTWREYLELILGGMDRDMEFRMREHIKQGIKQHYNKTNDSIDDEIPHAYTGFSWKFLCAVALRGDLKGRHIQKVIYQSFKNKEAKGMTIEQIKDKFGKK